MVSQNFRRQLVTSNAITTCEVREAVRRLSQPVGPFAVFSVWCHYLLTLFCSRLTVLCVVSRNFLWDASTLTADLAHLAKYCQQWRLKPSMSKTVTSVYHLHNMRSRRELDVQMNGQRLTHDPHPAYLTDTLIPTLSYREHSVNQSIKFIRHTHIISKQQVNKPWHSVTDSTQDGLPMYRAHLRIAYTKRKKKRTSKQS